MGNNSDSSSLTVCSEMAQRLPSSIEHKTAITKLIRNWFFAITMQKEPGVLLEMLATEFSLHFPEATLNNPQQFAEWYQGVRKQFFDQQHLIRSIEICFDAEHHASISLWVNWQARQRDIESPVSESLDFDALQQWQVVYQQDQWRIADYKVVELFSNQEGIS